MLYRPYVFLLFLLANSVADASAQSTSLDSVYVHPGVTVTATRGAVDLGRTPSRITIVDSLMLQHSARNDVASVLEAHSGTFIRRYGLGGLSTVSLRGTSPSQTLILIDGHRISDPQLGQIDLSLLPGMMLSQVEVMHGSASALYGSDGLGGAINLRTIGGMPHSSLARVSTGVGAFGERTASATAGGKISGMSLSAAVSREVLEGDFPYLDESRIPPQRVRREGGDRTLLSAFASAGYAVATGRVHLSALYADAERGLAGPGSAVGERQWDRRLHVWSNAERILSSGTLAGRVMLQHTSLRYLNPRLNEDQTGRTFAASSEVEWNTRVRRPGHVGVGVSSGFAGAEHPALIESPQELTLALFTHATLPAGALVAYPSARLDYYRSSAIAAKEWLTFNPRLALNFRLLDAVPLHLKAGVGRSFRAPTFNDRFWQPGGNPHLRPESGVTIEGGIFAGDHTRHLEVTAFTSAIRHQIIWLPAGFGYWSPSNRAGVRSRGIEASAFRQSRIADAVDLDARVIYTYTYARDRSDPESRSYNRPLRYVPAHQIKAHAAANLRPTSGHVTARFTDRRFVTTDGSQSLPPYLHVDVGVGFNTRFSGYRLQLFGDLTNALDAKYAVLQGHAMPPRHGRIRLVFSVD